MACSAWGGRGAIYETPSHHHGAMKWCPNTYIIYLEALGQFNTELLMSSVDSICSSIQSAEHPGNGLYWDIVNFIFMDLVLYI